jgi:hypothetical protein
MRDYKLLAQLCSLSSEIVVTIDALDECPHTLRLLDAVKEAQEGSSGKIKLFLSSRLHVPVDQVFTDFQDMEIDGSAVAIDLGRYINVEVDLRHNILPGPNSRKFKDRLKHALVQHAQGV